MYGNSGGAVTLYFNGAPKIATKSDGIDVTGEVQCDSLDVDGSSSFAGANDTQINSTGSLFIKTKTSGEGLYIGRNGPGDYQIYLGANDGSANFAGNVGCGVTSPATSLHVRGANTTGKGQFIVSSASAGQEARMTFIDGSDDIAEISTDNDNLYFYNERSSGAFQFYTAGSERLRLDSAGRLGVGVSSPTNRLHVGSSDTTAVKWTCTSSGSVYTRFQNTDNQRGYIGYEGKRLVFYADNGSNTGDKRVAFMDADGLKFNNDTAAANALDDYEEARSRLLIAQVSAALLILAQVGIIRKLEI